MDYKFFCPRCSGDCSIEEVLVDVVMASVITSIERDCADYGDYSTDGGVIDHFQCLNCGFTILDEEGRVISDYELLYDYLEEFHTLEDDE